MTRVRFPLPAPAPPAPPTGEAGEPGPPGSVSRSETESKVCEANLTRSCPRSGELPKGSLSRSEVGMCRQSFAKRNSVKVCEANLTRSCPRSGELPKGSQGEPDAHIAQSVEHSLGKGEVIGSNPIVSTIFSPSLGTSAGDGNGRAEGSWPAGWNERPAEAATRRDRQQRQESE